MLEECYVLQVTVATRAPSCPHDGPPPPGARTPTQGRVLPLTEQINECTLLHFPTFSGGWAPLEKLQKHAFFHFFGGGRQTLRKLKFLHFPPPPPKSPFTFFRVSSKN